MSVRFVDQQAGHARISSKSGEISSKNYISADALDDSGIIFVSSSDPLGRLAASITKEEFTTIGFYYVSKISKIPEVNVILVDILGAEYQPIKVIGIDELLDNPLVRNVAIKRLRPITNSDGSINIAQTRKLHEDFRWAITNTIGTRKLSRVDDFIRHLFGYPNTKEDFGGIGMINSVICKIGRSADLLDQPRTINQDSFDNQIQGTSLVDRVQFIGCLTSNLNQCHNGIQIQSYIVPNNLFGDLYHLRTRTFDPLVTERAMQDSIKVQKPFLDKMFSEFIHLLLEDPVFFETVLEGFRQGKNKASELQQTLVTALQISSESRIQDLTWISRNLSKGEISSKALVNILQGANDDHRTLISWFGSLAGLNNVQLDTCQAPIPRTDLDFRVLVKSDNPTNQSGGQLDLAVTQLYQLVNSVLTSAADNSQAEMDLNKLIECTNGIVACCGNKHQPLNKLPEQSSYSIIGTSSTKTGGEIAIQLDRGDEIFIPLHGSDLKLFERGELLEILQALDDNIEGIDLQGYNNLRAKITQELALR